MEEDMVVIILKSLPTSLEHFIETLNISSIDVDLKFEDLSTNSLQQDRCKKEFGIRNRNEGPYRVDLPK